MKAKQTFSHIAIVGRSGKANIVKTLNALKDYLISIERQVVIEQNTAELMQVNDTPTVPAENLSQHAELIIVVGGDGSLLNAAHIAIENNLPILGINRGRLGFLTDIAPTELERIGAILDGDHISEQRFLLGAKVTAADKTIAQLDALNDIVLLHADATHMIHFSVSIDGHFAYSQLADGLIIATPTGSTAYALSGGGPILHPQLQTLTLVPMLPHTLSNRPIVVDANAPLTIDLHDSEDANPAFLSADGMNRLDLPNPCQIHIRRKSHELTLVHSSDYNYYDTLRIKLGWQHYAKRG